jgi:hypothetical protein
MLTDSENINLLAALNHPDFKKNFGRYVKADWEKTVFSNKAFCDIPLALIGKTMIGIQHSAKKFPPLVQEPFSLLPPPEKINAAQSSSYITAKVKRDISEPYSRIVDLCGGYGIDAYYMHEGRNLVHVEPNEIVHKTAKFNFRSIENITCIQSTAEAYWGSQKFEKGDLLYADPSRVDDTQQRVSALKNYQPDVSGLPKLCRESSVGLLLKLSPMLDIDLLKNQWSDFDFNVHLVVVNNELKDLLLHFGSDTKDKTFVHHIVSEEEVVFEITGSLFSSQNCLAPKFVYDPNPAFKKLRVNGFLMDKFALSEDNGFLVSENFIEGFPGKVFELLEILELDKSTKKRITKGRFSVVSRHANLNSQTIEKRYKLVPDSLKFLLCFEQDAKAKMYLAERKY